MWEYVCLRKEMWKYFRVFHRHRAAWQAKRQQRVGRHTSRAVRAPCRPAVLFDSSSVFHAVELHGSFAHRKTAPAPPPPLLAAAATAALLPQRAPGLFARRGLVHAAAALAEPQLPPLLLRDPAVDLRGQQDGGQQHALKGGREGAGAARVRVGILPRGRWWKVTCAGAAVRVLSVAN